MSRSWAKISGIGFTKLCVNRQPIGSLSLAITQSTRFPNTAPTRILVDNLLPLMQKFGASAYFCGHEHNAQFLRVPGVDLVVSGAGHELDQVSIFFESFIVV